VAVRALPSVNAAVLGDADALTLDESELLGEADGLALTDGDGPSACMSSSVEPSASDA
jgi:hypothetical protein